jgi:hypothetical protein
MRRIIGAEVEVSEAERGMMAAHGLPLPAREVVEDVDPVAGREVELELVRLLEELDRQRQELQRRS